MLEGYLLLVTGVQNWKIKKCRKSKSRDIHNINVIYVSGKSDESKYKKIINALYRVLKNYDPDNKYHRQKSFINSVQTTMCQILETHGTTCKYIFVFHPAHLPDI